MPRLLALLASLLLLALISAACGDGNPDSSPTPVTPAPTPSQTATPAPDSTPAAGSTPASTPATTETPGPAPTLRSIAPPDDLAEFLEPYAEEQIIQKDCTYDLAAGQVDCAENGLYQPEPLPPSAEAECTVLLVDDQPIAVACENQQPLTVIYYEISR